MKSKDKTLLKEIDRTNFLAEFTKYSNPALQAKILQFRNELR